MEKLNKLDVLLEDLEKEFSKVTENDEISFRFQVDSEPLVLNLIDKSEDLGLGFSIYQLNTNICKGILYGDTIETIKLFIFKSLNDR